MTNKLQQYFPMIRTKEQLMAEIEEKPKLKSIFYSWKEEARQDFINFCTGARGVKMMHRFKQESDTGAKMNLLQKYLFVTLDNFNKIKHNNDKTIKLDNRLEAWLAFLSMDAPEDIVQILEQYSDFKALYNQVYDICLNIEEVMGMFSKELLELDRNTVELMIDEMQKQADNLRTQNENMTRENEKLVFENESIKSENESIKSENESIKSENERIKNENKEIRAMMEELKRQNEEILKSLGKK